MAVFFLVLFIIVFVGLAGLAISVRRRQKRQFLLILVLTAVVGGAWYSLVLFDSVANWLFFPDDTSYAPGYSENAFGKVRKGQRSHEVEVILGQPINKSLSWDKKDEYWYYSRPGKKYDNYWNKIVIFDARDGCVTDKVSELYSD